jgi:hypothetical protein
LTHISIANLYIHQKKRNEIGLRRDKNKKKEEECLLFAIYMQMMDVPYCKRITEG